ncbi:hypothetical protein GGI05_001482 [Coemansia sp. RSA 2603]|nr:hypothetical protein GGI05_001482 [Coemansia sp. RSA 2603]
MNPQAPSTGFAALDGLLKRAREQKKANPISSKRVAVAVSSANEKGDTTNRVARSNPQSQPQLPQSSHDETQTDLDSLDAADALLDFDPEDIDGLLDGLSTDNTDTLIEASQPANFSQQISPTPAGLATAPSSQAVPAVRPSQPTHTPHTPAVRPGSTASSKLSQFKYQPSAQTPSAVELSSASTPRTSAIIQQTRSVTTSASSFAAKGSSSAFKTVIERTIVDSRRQSGRASSSSRQEVPGPAGLVNRVSVADTLDISAPTQRPVSAFRTPFAQQRTEKTSDADFESGTWAAMLDFLNLPSYTPQTTRHIMREHKDVAGVTVQWVQQNAKQTQKVPRMLVQIQDITGGNGDSDASSVLVDPTGEISASIHRQVVTDLSRECTAGTSIILDNVVVMLLPGAKPFLVITSASIMRVFAVEVTAGSRSNPITITQTQTQTQPQGRARQQPDETPTRGPNKANALSVNESIDDVLASQRPIEVDVDASDLSMGGDLLSKSNNDNAEDVLNVFDSVFADDDLDNADSFIDMLDSGL